MPAFDSAVELRRLERRPVRLVFDTADEPLPAGVRRRDVGSRHLLYEAGDLSLDVRLETDPHTPLAVLVGQILDRREPLEPLVGWPVFLVAGDEIRHHTVSNAHGAFLINCELDGGPINLCVLTAEGRLIEMSVGGASARPE